jgi:hypothetical protein
MLLDAFPGMQAIVERKIADAIARGEFDHLPGAGKPLALDDDALVPEELRVAHRILKNAGYVPAELEQVAEVRQLLDIIERAADDSADAARATRRLNALLMTLELQGRNATVQSAWQEYHQALARRLDRSAQSD